MDQADEAATPGHDAPPGAALPLLAAGAGAFDLLDGVRVLDLTTSIAGPYAGMLLGDLGAEVVKVERPGAGDDARAWGPPFLDGESLWFVAVNRNKRSVTLDITSAAGAEVLRGLIGQADVLLVNQPARSLAKLGLAPEQLRAARPELIHVSITGFGLTGERADHAGYDLIAEGYSGVMDLTGTPESEPQKVGAPTADMLAGQDAAMAAMAALFARAHTGRGRSIDIALTDSMTRFLTCRIVPFLGSGEVPRRSGGRDSVIAIYQAFETADEPITLGLGNDGVWRRFWEAVGRPERGRDPSHGSNALRRAHRAAIVADIQDILRGRPRAEWLAAFAAARVPAGPINRVDQVVADPALIARGLFYQVEAQGTAMPQVGTGILLDGAANRPRLPPPRLGADTAAVLGEWLGLDAARVAALKAEGAL
ncbi:CaiB/BaiF CoA transferase family protein [Belnapia rosea]|uniref:Crotonobetainyl-CoA:carnitine CoA-transferase CaiB n=1 Tax=Belnapia rosea TaxID=938405 RepID=A0A1G7DU30_9PROT|nr:CoA transferase [Belnapia rosea]SDB75002.1 Crotonobetainyl-CoA:carnitine CoA-transferase CaiB [Belnapia rosea]SDE54968.1 Crotonobetainyl-CoA:carnitine CoA-transferase CaiB [Belnapia rosea]